VLWRSTGAGYVTSGTGECAPPLRPVLSYDGRAVYCGLSNSFSEGIALTSNMPAGRLIFRTPPKGTLQNERSIPQYTLTRGKYLLIRFSDGHVAMFNNDWRRIFSAPTSGDLYQGGSRAVDAKPLDDPTVLAYATTNAIMIHTLRDTAEGVGKHWFSAGLAVEPRSDNGAKPSESPSTDCRKECAFPTGDNVSPNVVRLSTNARFLFAALDDGSVRVVDTTTGTEIDKLGGWPAGADDAMDVSDSRLAIKCGDQVYYYDYTYLHFQDSSYSPQDDPKEETGGRMSDWLREFLRPVSADAWLTKEQVEKLLRVEEVASPNSTATPSSQTVTR
jgi:hypothetical protein